MKQTVSSTREATVNLMNCWGFPHGKPNQRTRENLAIPQVHFSEWQIVGHEAYCLPLPM
jgi:hypothetical protein